MNYVPSMKRQMKRGTTIYDELQKVTHIQRTVVMGDEHTQPSSPNPNALRDAWKTCTILDFGVIALNGHCCLYSLMHERSIVIESQWRIITNSKVRSPDEQIQNIWFVQVIAAQLGIITHQQLYNTAIVNMATLWLSPEVSQWQAVVHFLCLV